MVPGLLPFRLRLDMIAVIEDDAAVFDRVDMVFVRMLVEGQQDISVIAGTEHFAGADAHLENRGPARDGGGDGHESHDLLLASTRQPRQETADSLNAVLRIAGDADDGFGNFGDFWAASRG